MARLAIGKEFLAEYAKLDRNTRSAVDTAIAEFARQTHAGPFLEVRDEEELRLILAHPFAAWRAFLHPSQHEIAYRVSYSGSAQVTDGPGTGKTVTVLHRAAFLAERAGQPRLPRPVLLTTLNGNLAESLHAQLDLLPNGFARGFRLASSPMPSA